MKIKAQYAMVLNLDKCIGCHTCSIPCKNVWTNRDGAEYMWFNNVECKPGIGYPKKWENQDVYRGGWELSRGRLRLKAGGRLHKGLNIFHNPDLPVIDDYYEPWNYDYARLIESPKRKHQPSVRPHSRLTGEPIKLKWGPNWEDDLAGLGETGAGDANFKNLELETYLQFRNVFMFWLPRLCEHCLNPACVASCPSGALYKREEDGIVLVDQERCRGWRYCVSGCPYKKVYFNWKTGRAEKCIFCYPRIEAGLTTLCAHSCVGRIRYVGVLLYDADRIGEAAAAPSDQAVYPAHLEILLDPNDPEIERAAVAQGIAPNMLAAAKRSPTYALIKEWRLALPLHPEFRTLPMVWYVPPLSPVSSRVDPSQESETIARLRKHKDNPKFVALGERLEKLKERHEQGLLHSLDFLKELLTLAKEVVQAEKQVDPVDEQARAKAALTELFAEVKNGKTPMVVERIVTDIDEIVRLVRFPGWQNTKAGEREVQKALRKVIYVKYQIKDQDLFDKAFGYIRQYY